MDGQEAAIRGNRAAGAADVSTRVRLRLASLSELDAMLEQARVEGWRDLAVFETEAWDPLGEVTQAHTLYIKEPLGARISTVAALTQLRSLDLSGNQIGDDGARALAGLTQLTQLGLSGNCIGDEGARALARLTQLTRLDLNSNWIGAEGARALAGLTQLSRLYLYGNEIGDEGAQALAGLSQLSSLDLSGNQIGDVGARALAGLTQLHVLVLRGNQIGDEGARALAGLAQLAGLTRLPWLDLSVNQIGAAGARALLDGWCDHPGATSLRRLDLRDNGDMTSLLPPEVLESADAQSMLAAYRRYRSDRQRNALRPLNEAKLLVVGNEAVGKTSLIRYLVHGRPRDPDQKETRGTAIHEKIEVSTWSVHQSPVRLNVWDFGGQEIMRGTHRFFLTERSLYLLVAEDRRKDDRSIDEWLEIIKQRGGDSPVIVVVNKCDGDLPSREIDEPALRRAHPAIVGFVRTSCNAGSKAAGSIAALRRLIATTLARSERLRHVREQLPPSWLRVKEAIAALARSRSVLPVRELERLCEDDTTGAAGAITDSNEQRALLALLHDLGVLVAHGLRRDAPAAWREIMILDPNWLTGAIYALINSPEVRDQGGELAHEQLGDLLDPGRYPASRHELILGMMQQPEMGLCLAIDHVRSPRYLLPDALPSREPDCGAWPDDALRFRFLYSLVPSDFIARFIAEAHRRLTDRPTWWRTGVVLGAEGCRILVRAEPLRRRVEIVVDGTTGKRAALGIVRDYFDAVHRRYPGLTVEARVPLPDQPDVDVGYEHLVTLERRKGIEHSFLPEKARREYAVRELLEGVRDDAYRSRDAVGRVVDWRDTPPMVPDPGGPDPDRDQDHSPPPNPPVAMTAPLPKNWFTDTVKAVPSLKWALAVAALAAIFSVARSYAGGPLKIVVAVLILLGLSIVMVVFSTLATKRRAKGIHVGPAAYILTYLVVVLVVAYAVFATTSLWFGWPIPGLRIS